EQIAAYEKELLDYATQQLLGMDGLKIYGTAPHKASLISFLLHSIHPYDVGLIIDKMGVAVRTGHHCAMPLMEYLQIPGTIRASFAFYNTREEIDRLVEAVLKAKEMLL
ncbi:MAG: aminotransferase class V-fold PLP-dependent enzyme, partial [Bacteroidales bacterium]|nr:aminotransferase class V-fold PLP-dependent enzyme [Bacteroidales bacterium]